MNKFILSILMTIATLGCGNALAYKKKWGETWNTKDVPRDGDNKPIRAVV